ncbi:MAG: hypothetical protein JOY86_09360 [Candidatus Eremiobacteraeota bacterium]|nr:hypothetical protein [Candidatus Eremiobacteraeota bacterium]
MTMIRLSNEPTEWPQSALQAESVSFDGERLSFVTPTETIQFVIDGNADVTLSACEYVFEEGAPLPTSSELAAKGLTMRTQRLTTDQPIKRKTLIGPEQGAIFTPPREYYIPRDLKSLLAAGLGVILASIGFWVAVTTRGTFVGGWFLVLAGVYLVVATIFDTPLIPPWRH